VIVWDAHACLPLHPDADFTPLEQFRSAGVHYVSVNVGMDMNPVSQIAEVIASFRRRLAAEPDRYLRAVDFADVETACASGRLAVGFDLEGAMPLEERPDRIVHFRDLGVRQIHFAYNRNNSVADGCHDVERGLTPLGRRMVAADNQAGLLMDCSHTGRRCSLEIMEASSAPVVFSHANPAALVNHGRNLTDEQIRCCAATGGVVCVSGVSAFVGSARPTAEDVARHAAYVAELVGVEHAGIGLDICFQQDGLDDAPPGGVDRGYWWPASAGYGHGLDEIAFAPVETWTVLAAALAAQGFDRTEAALVMGANMARVARQAWSR